MVDWNALIHDCGPMVSRISWRILGDAAEVEDNVQDVFLEACRVHQRTAVRHWPGFLRRLATLGALTKLRRRRRHASLGDQAPPDARPGPEATAMGRELETKLRVAVAALPEREGAVFALRYFEGQELPEIAACLEISYSAAGTALSRARAKLANLFTETVKEDK
jgi:RNA polymerase sigma-70 factor (ECF subfamily)